MKASEIAVATLTLLGLIIGFTFSKAINRYEQRRNYEPEEANAIGTEYVQAGQSERKDQVNRRNIMKSLLLLPLFFFQDDGEPRGPDGNYHDERDGHVQPDMCGLKSDAHPCNCYRNNCDAEANGQDARNSDPGDMCQTYCRKNDCHCHPDCEKCDHKG
jgi:hypothetical protein